jgi:hypothetical protein
MRHVGGRRSFGIILVLAILFSASAVLAESVDLARAQKATEGFLKGRSALADQGANGAIRALAVASTPAGFREVRDDDGTVLAYVADLEPRGFIALSADTDIAPVVAYSFLASFPAGADKANPLFRLLRADLKLRIKSLAENPDLKTEETARLWEVLAAGQTEDDASFQQWPPEGTTSTGGWVTTTWGQDEPFNAFCPLDPSDGLRSYVGCVATAFVQLVHYHRLCDVTFTQDDAYTTYSGIRFDADSDLYNFPSFSELNGYLSKVRTKYSRGAELDDTDMAALSSACGVAVEMDYSSDGSGAPTSAVQEALVERFGYYSADLFDALTDTGLVALQENLINGQPTLLSFSPPDGWGGHVVVCDGYNTRGEYHLNFGWGSDAPQKITEAWYQIPTATLYRDCVFTECVLNVQAAQPAMELDSTSLSFYAAPGEQSQSQVLRIRNNTADLCVESITCPDGFLIDRNGQGYADRLGSFTIESLRQGAAINVAFKPAQAGDYYGILVIRYGDGGLRNVILKGWAYGSGTTVAAGEVSGTWSRDKSPYFVTGDVAIPKGGKLVIESGVKVLFAQDAGLTVGQSARLTAQGNDAQPIELTAWNRAAGWGGLRFVNSSSDDVLSYCLIRYAKKDAGLDPQDDAATVSDVDLFGGAVYCETSDPTIENCRITNNTGGKGGAIYCVDSYPIISNTLIANNMSVGGASQCGGICVDAGGVPEIWNCTIVNNFPGGLFSTSWDGLNVVNTILWGNGRYQIQTDECRPTVTFCDVQDGFSGEGNMAVDPCFINPSGGAGTGYDGASANWALRPSSPCINSGMLMDELPTTDLAGASRIHCDVVDLGAYENQSDLPLITATPSTTVDAGFVALNSSKTVVVELANTGTDDFKIVDTSIAQGAFSVETAVQNKVLAPGGVAQVKVRFQPTQEKAYTGTLTVRSNCSNAPAMAIDLRGVGITGTAVPAGTVKGAWKKANSPYTVTGDISVAKNQTLTIEPGVVVRFAGHFSLTVGYRATLKAVGTEQDKIQFTATDLDEGWFGIRFINSSTEDQLKYCTIQYAHKDRVRDGGFYGVFGGAILCTSSEDDEPGYGLISGPTIDSCTFSHNYARTGGAIMCYAGGYATITNNVIMDNYADADGGGIALYAADCTIANNVIVRNYAGAGGGIMNWLSAPTIRNNTLVANKPSALHLESNVIPDWSLDAVSIVNNIIWQNEIYMADDVEDGEYLIRYNDIQGGWTGTGNLAVDPLFADAQNDDYHLKSKAGRWDPVAKSWVLDSVTSPCVDAGDPSTSIVNEPQPRGLRVNMGAYGGTAQASKSPSGS